MIIRLVDKIDEIYKDEGSDHGLVMSVTWAHIYYNTSGNGMRTLRIMEGGTQSINGTMIEVLKIYVHPESDGIWFYGRDIASGQIFNIEPTDVHRYESGIGSPFNHKIVLGKDSGWVVIGEDFNRDDLPY